MRFITRSARNTQQVAKTLFNRLRRSKNQPFVLAFSGNLGSGKTTFVQGLARTLGIREKIQSPTFVLMKWYDVPRVASRGFPKHFRSKKYFVHIDAYRLHAARDAKHLGLRTLFRDPAAIVVIEWADRIKKLIPKNAVWIYFKHAGKNQRLIEVRNSTIARPRRDSGEAGEIRNRPKV